MGDEFIEDAHIRCPKCLHIERVEADTGIYAEGEHVVSCNSCGEDYTVSTRVYWSFHSLEKAKAHG